MSSSSSLPDKPNQININTQINPTEIPAVEPKKTDKLLPRPKTSEAAGGSQSLLNREIKRLPSNKRIGRLTSELIQKKSTSGSSMAEQITPTEIIAEIRSELSINKRLTPFNLIASAVEEGLDYSQQAALDLLLNVPSKNREEVNAIFEKDPQKKYLFRFSPKQNILVLSYRDKMGVIHNNDCSRDCSFPGLLKLLRESMSGSSSSAQVEEEEPIFAPIPDDLTSPLNSPEEIRDFLRLKGQLFTPDLLKQADDSSIPFNNENLIKLLDVNELPREAAEELLKPQENAASKSEEKLKYLFRIGSKKEVVLSYISKEGKVKHIEVLKQLELFNPKREKPYTYLDVLKLIKSRVV